MADTLTHDVVTQSQRGGLADDEAMSRVSYSQRPSVELRRECVTIRIACRESQPGCASDNSGD